MPVYAPIDGKVIRVGNGWKDHEYTNIWRTIQLWYTATYKFKPKEENGRLDIRPNAGNHVMIQGKEGYIVFIAHLKNQSILVTEGEQVRQGQVRWETGAALSPSGPDVAATAKNCSNAAKDCSRCRSRSFKDSESDSKKQQRQRQTTTVTAKNCSNIPPDFQPLLDLLVDRCGTPAKIARDTVCISVRRGDDPVFVQYDALRWLAYCLSKLGKTINVPGFFIASKIQNAEPCPDYFQTDYGSPLHPEIRALEEQLE